MTIWQDVEQLFEGKPEPRLRPIAGRRMFGPATDEVGPPVGQRVEGEIEGLTIGILYRDAQNAASERVIRCRSLSVSGGIYFIEADCLLRQARRTFRLDRIEQITDYTTGEIIPNVGEFFSGYIDTPLEEGWREPAGRRPRQSAWIAPTSTNPRVATAFRDGVRVLLYLALSDGELHQAEQDFIVKYATDRLRRLPALPAPPDHPEQIARRWIDNQVPTRAAAFASLGRLCLNDDDGAEIAYAMIDLIIADGTASDGEMAAAWNIVAALEERERGRPVRP